MAADAQVVRIADVGAQLRRRWRVLAFTAVVCALLAIIAGLLLGPSYTATSVVTVQPITAHPFGETDSEPVNIVTESAVVQSTEVARRARELMGTGESPADLIDRISVTSPSESQVLEIEATAEDPATAARIANAFANAYLADRTDTATRNIDKTMVSLGTRIAELTAQLRSTESGQEARVLREEINNLRTQQNDLATIAINPGRVITEASEPEGTSSPGLLIYGTGGLVAGALLGTGLALLRERTDPLVRSETRLTSATGLVAIEQHPQESTMAFLDRLVVRAGIEPDGAKPGAIGVLGVDRASAGQVGIALAGHLQACGRQARFEWMVRDNGTRPIGQADVDVVLLGASEEDGLATVARLARRSNHLIMTAARWATLSSVRRTAEELAAAGAKVDAVVLVATDPWKQA